MPTGCKKQSTTHANGALLIDTGGLLPIKVHLKLDSWMLTIARSGPTETGMSRLSLSDDDAQVRRWFAEETKKLGCSLVVDELGNMFASRRGSLPKPTPMIAMGSHLDTQPRGGRYDGILGVVAAVEVLRTLAENGYSTHHDVGIVNWTKYVSQG